MTTRCFTASSIDGFIADSDHSLSWLLSRDVDTRGPMGYERFVEEQVGALAMGSTTYRWIVDHQLGGDPADAPVSLGAGAPLLPRHLELRLEEVARNRDFACARYTVLR